MAMEFRKMDIHIRTYALGWLCRNIQMVNAAPLNLPQHLLVNHRAGWTHQHDVPEISIGIIVFMGALLGTLLGVAADFSDAAETV